MGGSDKQPTQTTLQEALSAVTRPTWQTPWHVYSGLLAAALEDDHITPEEADRLKHYREKHKIGDAEHAAALQGLGWSCEQFDSKELLGVEAEAYAHVMAATLSDSDAAAEEVGAILAEYRRRHGVDGATQAAALKQLGLTQAQLDARCCQPTAGAVESYVAMLRETLALGASAIEADEVGARGERAAP